MFTGVVGGNHFNGDGCLGSLTDQIGEWGRRGEEISGGIGT
jgi:hypothetical protein